MVGDNAGEGLEELDAIGDSFAGADLGPGGAPLELALDDVPDDDEEARGPDGEVDFFDGADMISLCLLYCPVRTDVVDETLTPEHGRFSPGGKNFAMRGRWPDAMGG